METRHRLVHLGAEWAILLSIILGTPAWGRATEPLDVIRESFRASSQRLTSGVGKGTFRHYVAIPGGDWQLKRDADVLAFFDAEKYHVQFIYHRDDVLNEDARRIIYDGRLVMGRSFTPGGSTSIKFKPEDDGRGLAQPFRAGFPWDIAQLSGNVWNPDFDIRDPTRQRVEIRQTSDGDLVGTYLLSENLGVRIQFECAGRFGFNLARQQVFNVGQPKPKRDTRIEWKRGPSGVWYVRSIADMRVVHDVKVGVLRVRDVLKYTEFEPNARVDPRLFTEEARRLPARSPIIDGRPGAAERDRRVP